MTEKGRIYSRENIYRSTMFYNERALFQMNKTRVELNCTFYECMDAHLEKSSLSGSSLNVFYVLSELAVTNCDLKRLIRG